MAEEFDEEEIEEDLQDEKEDSMEEDTELREELSKEDAEDYGYTQPTEIFDRMKFLTQVRDNEDSLRTSYLTKGELGTPLFPVRFWEEIKVKADIRGYALISAYIRYRALSTTSTGLSREGFLVNSVITKRKENFRTRNKQNQEVKKNESK